VATGLPAATVAAAIHAAGGELLRAVRLFDVYAGPPLASDERSLAYRLSFGAPDRTLTEAEIETALAAVTAAIATVGGRVRT
jgi:phenylalanyl-tRNA synthetase beta chain